MSEKQFYYGIFDDGTEYIEDYKKKKYYFNLDDVEELLNKQQATIFQLQDLCGESDGENAKLRIENKSLKDDLHNCRLNKNIISEKLKVWQDVHKEYDIYNIKDFEKLMKKVKQKQ